MGSSYIERHYPWRTREIIAKHRKTKKQIKAENLARDLEMMNKKHKNIERRKKVENGK